MPADRRLLIELERIARAAGDLLVAHRPGASNAKLVVTTKADGTPVTNADLLSHDLILSQLAVTCPGEVVVSEESDLARHAECADAWHVDPLDGTQPFMNGEDYFAVFIGHRTGALCDVGVMYYPIRQVVCSAAVGVGVWWNGAQIGAVGESPIQEGRVVTQFTSIGVQPSYLSAHRYPTRNLALLDLCRGMSDAVVAGYSSGYVNMWDVCAVLAILRAAGLEPRTLQGAEPRMTPLRLEAPELLVTTAARHEQLQKLLIVGRA